MHAIHSRAEEPHQLYSMQAIEAEVPLSEAFDRLELPNGIDEVAWKGFKGCTIYVAVVFKSPVQSSFSTPKGATKDHNQS